MEITWSPDSLDRLDDISDFIAKDSRERAEAFVERLIESVDRLKTFPASGVITPEHPAFRHVVVQGYRIIYRLCSDKVEIVTVVGPGQLFTEPLLSPAKIRSK